MFPYKSRLTFFIFLNQFLSKHSFWIFPLKRFQLFRIMKIDAFL
ncbi:hypothetical protein LEP1GSC103_0365 [Leptospira borgpetersenii serovar Javanica str. UI 09931]|uniref:Uncharacterized protein n=4 Tax=Leptospira borgpetersenii TaxID=174 RepID=M3HPZ3_LEPBO|nr:hypothetical protein LBBP_03240 [Leptospira borgpetersenii serovar Ballum]EKP14494.1 hypothetical protein LEP1GSC128_1585 [Leptospira borgpetersenii str. 200801926]EKQ92572.1 hypothetical protein LEP1GSC101_2770 [Leptospira borgpetersenii str. UI 09149]EKQ99673.1 hypothetical protein LEP1GSC121_2063 [Leptospira borgpetersenii serovar Castellonis str. 200801910]EMF99729.1 hypothetical protein LEP1GSC123_2620 [Leptospira borgpetersenii str. 200701203]EMK12412.1 hypothetical protein LEP1GSC066